LLTWLLASALALATPPPLPDEGPPRIRGLTQLFVTPEAFVNGLMPIDPDNPQRPDPLYVLRVADDAPLTAEEVVAHLSTIEGVKVDLVDGEVRARAGDSSVDLPTHRVPADGEKIPLAALGDLAIVPVPRPTMPNGTQLPAPPLEPTGYDLQIHSPIIGLRVGLEVQGTVIGELAPYQVAILRDVRPGSYHVALLVPSGHREEFTVEAVKRGARTSDDDDDDDKKKKKRKKK